MRAGNLRHTVTLQSPLGSRDAVGERITTWTDEATVAAEIRPLTSREQFIAAQRQASTTHFVSMRYSTVTAGINAAWRLMFMGRIFTINGPPKNIEERNKELQLDCTEGLTTQ